MKHVSFGKIGQYKDTIKNLIHHLSFIGLNSDQNPVYDTSNLPIITFIGTVKLHGTNTSICLENDKLYSQAKRDIISTGHYGFSEYAQYYQKEFKELFKELFPIQEKDAIYTIFGEWAGTNIKKGVAICKIPEKSFFIFSASVSNIGDKVDENGDPMWEKTWHSSMHLFLSCKIPRCYSIYDFPNWTIEIDLNNPKLVQNNLIDITNKVEEQCPVALKLGFEGVGEGVVWHTFHKGNQYRFKVKGEKHSVTKVKKLVSVDVEKLAKIKDAIEYLVTKPRLDQAIFEIVPAHQEATRKHTGDILRWIANDIKLEENGTLIENGLDWKDIANPLTGEYRDMYFKIIDFL